MFPFAIPTAWDKEEYKILSGLQILVFSWYTPTYSQINTVQKQPFRGVLLKRCSENMQQIYRRTPIPKCDFNKVALQCNFIDIALRHGCSPVNLLRIFRTPSPKNTSERLLLTVFLNILCNNFTQFTLRKFGPFVQFKKREKHQCRSVNFSKVAGFTKINTPPWVFFTFFKLYKWYQIAQRITFRALSNIFGGIFLH